MKDIIATPLKFRPHDWLNTETMEPAYGVQASRGGRWMHCHKSGEITFFETIADRSAWIDRMTAHSAREASK